MTNVNLLDTNYALMRYFLYLKMTVEHIEIIP